MATVNDNDPRVEYTATASQTTFTRPFFLNAEADLDVYVNGTLTASGYTHTGVGANSGTIVFSSGRTAGDIIILSRSTAAARSSAYSAGQPLPASSLEDDATRALLLQQEAVRDVRRSIRAPVTDTDLDPDDGDLELPATALRANKYPVFGADGKTISMSAGTGADLGLREDLADTAAVGNGDDLVGVKQTDGKARTQHERNADILHLTDFSTIVADGTDQTTAINDFLDGLGAAATGVYIAPPGLKFTRSSVITHIPVGVVILDFTGLGGFSHPQETAKIVGVLTSDKTENDTGLGVSSGHHAYVMLNNYGTGLDAGPVQTPSAAACRTSLFAARGEFEAGTSTQRGNRVTNGLQWEDNGNDRWHLKWVKYAPFAAAFGGWERWNTGQIYGAGAYCSNGDNFYSTVAGGTAGGSEPVHTSGSASDGGITWDYVGTVTEPFIVDDYGRIRTNLGNQGAATYENVLSLKQSAESAQTAYGTYLEPTGNSRETFHKLRSTDSGGTAQQPPFPKTNGTALQMRRGDDAGDLAEWSDSGGFAVREIRYVSKTAADGDTTPSVDAASTLFVSNTGATSITALDDGNDNQRVTVIATNANTTLIHSATLMLTGSANQLLSAYSSVTFHKVPNSISNRWIEVARSIK